MAYRSCACSGRSISLLPELILRSKSSSRWHQIYQKLLMIRAVNVQQFCIPAESACSDVAVLEKIGKWLVKILTRKPLDSLSMTSRSPFRKTLVNLRCKMAGWLSPIGPVFGFDSLHTLIFNLDHRLFPHISFVSFGDETKEVLWLIGICTLFISDSQTGKIFGEQKQIGLHRSVSAGNRVGFLRHGSTSNIYRTPN